MRSLRIHSTNDHVADAGETQALVTPDDSEQARSQDHRVAITATIEAEVGG